MLESLENLFNNCFTGYFTLETLIQKATDNSVIREETAESLKLRLEDQTREFAILRLKRLSSTSICFNVSDSLKVISSNIIYVITFYLNKINPYEALNSLFVMSVQDLFDISKSKYDAYIKNMSNRLCNSKQINLTSPAYQQLSRHFGELLHKLSNIDSFTNDLYLVDATTLNFGYKFLNYSPHIDTGMATLENAIFAYSIESNILSKFDTKAVNQLIKLYEKNGRFTSNYLNIVLNNYIYSNLISDEHSDNPLSLSATDISVMLTEIKLGTISEKEIRNALFNGKVSFIPEEKKYLEKYFLIPLYMELKKKVFPDITVTLIGNHKVPAH